MTSEMLGKHLLGDRTMMWQLQTSRWIISWKTNKPNT